MKQSKKGKEASEDVVLGQVQSCPDAWARLWTLNCTEELILYLNHLVMGHAKVIYETC